MKLRTNISFIVVNFNGMNYTKILLDSLIKHLSKYEFEVVVVDNGSSINESAILKNDYPLFKFIRSDINLGFSGGNNLALRAATGDFFMLINNDAYIIDDSVILLKEFLTNNRLAGAVSPKILFEKPKNFIQYAGFTKFSSISLRNSAIGYMKLDIGQYNAITKVWSIHGAAMMIRRELLEVVGLMPDIYFLYYEEFDWSEKIRNAGFDLWYNPVCTVVHKDGSSVSMFSALKAFYMSRNRLLYAYRNLGGITRFLSIAYQLFIVLPKDCIKYLLKRNIKIVFAIINGAFSFVMLKNKKSCTSL
jgi:GT2 family glycosyltransferase